MDERIIANIRVINTFDFSDLSHIITSDTSMHSELSLYMPPQGLKVGSVHSSVFSAIYGSEMRLKKVRQ